MDGWYYLYRGADKTFARPGRKQATATEDFEFDVFSTVHHSRELFHQPTLIHNFLYSLTICLLHYYPEDGHVSARNMSRIMV